MTTSISKSATKSNPYKKKPVFTVQFKPFTIKIKLVQNMEMDMEETLSTQPEQGIYEK